MLTYKLLSTMLNSLTPLNCPQSFFLNNIFATSRCFLMVSFFIYLHICILFKNLWDLIGVFPIFYISLEVNVQFSDSSITYWLLSFVAIFSFLYFEIRKLPAGEVINEIHSVHILTLFTNFRSCVIVLFDHLLYWFLSSKKKSLYSTCNSSTLMFTYASR